jgi:hypothetical protein
MALHTDIPIHRTGVRLTELEVENFALRSGTGHLGKLIDELHAELEQAKKDAARYRWLQPALISGGALDDDNTLAKAFCHMETMPISSEFDAAIDAAIAKEQS